MVITSPKLEERKISFKFSGIKEQGRIRFFVIRKNYQTIYDRELVEMDIWYCYLNAGNRLFPSKHTKLKTCLKIQARHHPYAP